MIEKAILLTYVSKKLNNLWLPKIVTKRMDGRCYNVIITTDGDWDDHTEACILASDNVGIKLGMDHNESQGKFFTNGICLTGKQILENELLLKIWRLPDKVRKYHLNNGSEYYISIFEAVPDSG